MIWNAVQALFNPFVGVVTLVAFITSLLASRKQNKDARALQISMQSTLDRLTLIANDMSTKFVGNFPDYLPGVARLINDSSTSIKIMAMVCSHGSFTAPESWQLIDSALQFSVGKKKEQDPPIEAVLLYGSSDKIFTRYQHPNGANSWELWKAQARNIELLEVFFAREELTENIGELTRDRFRELRHREHEKVRRTAYRYFNTALCPESMPMYLWIRDGREAIFSVRTEDMQGRYAGAGFHTTDGRLVSELEKLFEHYQSQSRPLA